MSDTTQKWDDRVNSLAQEFGVSERTIRRWWDKIRDTTPKEKRMPKILLFDIETSFSSVYVHSLDPGYISPENIIQDWVILTFSVKYLFEPIQSFKMTEKELRNLDDARLTRLLWSFIDQSDIIIAHNLNRFDLKKANTRFLKHGLYKPSPVKTIDTLVHARKQFSILSNSLSYLATFLGLGKKMDTPKGMWKAVMEGDYESLEKMFEYCAQDVALLEDVYLSLRPYIVPHPNIGLFIDEDIKCCPSCGSEELVFDGEYVTDANVYDALRCKSCGSISRSKRGTAKTKNLIKSVTK